MDIQKAAQQNKAGKDKVIDRDPYLFFSADDTLWETVLRLDEKKGRRHHRRPFGSDFVLIEGSEAK